MQIDASMDNDELEAVRQTMTFVLGFYRKWHEEHYHRNKVTFEYGRAARTISEVPKNDDCLPEFHARVEGYANFLLLFYFKKLKMPFLESRQVTLRVWLKWQWKSRVHY